MTTYFYFFAGYGAYEFILITLSSTSNLADINFYTSALPVAISTLFNKNPQEFLNNGGGSCYLGWSA